MQLFDALQEVDESEMFPLIQAVKRLTAFAESHSIYQYNTLITNNTFTILKWAVYNEGFSSEFVSRALSLARAIITWNLTRLLDLLKSSENTNQNDDGNNDANLEEKNVEIKDLCEYLSKLSKKYFKLCSKLFVNENAQIEEEAYFEMCDILILFSPHLSANSGISPNIASNHLKSLHLDCSLNDMNMLAMYVNAHVFTEDALKDAKADSAETIERLHKKRSILAAFAKLISFNCVPIRYAAEIFRAYIKYAPAYMDIVKHLLHSCRDISKVNTAKAICLALQREYSECAQQHNGEDANRMDRSSSEFLALKDLAHRFCLSFGPEASVKSREAIVAIHQEAIKFALESTASSINASQASNASSVNLNQAPPNLVFLECIIEFSSRLTPQDKRNVLGELDKAFAKRANKIEANNWHSYYAYRIRFVAKKKFNFLFLN